MSLPHAAEHTSPLRVVLDSTQGPLLVLHYFIVTQPGTHTLIYMPADAGNISGWTLSVQISGTTHKGACSDIQGSMQALCVNTAVSGSGSVEQINDACLDLQRSSKKQAGPDKVRLQTPHQAGHAAS